MKRFKFLIFVILLTIPAFIRMLKPGIFSMSDFHLFRLYEFDKCVKALQIPCRWAPDAGLGYGEPLFNFYPQLPYVVGELYHLLGGNLIDSLKFLFILSFAGSAVAMFFLAKHLWKNEWGAVISAILYLYTPYRAVDVWVRGALPEALSFVLFPLIILAIEKRKFLVFGFLFSVLILTHNLSALMFLPVILAWTAYKKYWKAFWGLAIAGGLSSFYLLPVIFESKFINLASATQGYFDFRAHFLTLRQIFLDFSWGYGASIWGDGDGLNLSIGLMQWLLPILIFIMVVWKKKLKENGGFLILTGLGTLLLFLTHNKSTFVWENLPFMKYIQFPWRFFGVAVFCFSLASGALVEQLNKKFVIFAAVGVTFLSLIFNFSFFRPDLWYKVEDSYFLSGPEWDRQRTASIGDFWPNFGHEIPITPSDGRFVNYFPGWNHGPDSEGLIPSEGAVFKNTPVRNIGNIISLATLCAIILFSLL